MPIAEAPRRIPRNARPPPRSGSRTVGTTEFVAGHRGRDEGAHRDDPVLSQDGEELLRLGIEPAEAVPRSRSVSAPGSRTREDSIEPPPPREPGRLARIHLREHLPAAVGGAHQVGGDVGRARRHGHHVEAAADGEERRRLQARGDAHGGVAIGEAATLDVRRVVANLVVPTSGASSPARARTRARPGGCQGWSVTCHRNLGRLHVLDRPRRVRVDGAAAPKRVRYPRPTARPPPPNALPING